MLKKLLRPESILCLLFLLAVAYMSHAWNGFADVEKGTVTERPDLIDSPSVTTQDPAQKVSVPRKGEAVRFLHFNVENYFVMGETSRTRYEVRVKSEASKNAVADTIIQSGAHVVGMCEMGGPKALLDLKDRLARKGKLFPYHAIVIPPQDPRCLALLSMYPIHDDSVGQVKLSKYSNRTMLRGILDVSVECPDGRTFKFVGVHLKSKLDLQGNGDTDKIRREEAYGVRHYLDQLERRFKGLPVVVFGDFNDTTDSPALNVIRGDLRSAEGFSCLDPRDSNGEGWTIYYKGGRTYYAYDHILFNNDMSSRVKDQIRSGVIGGQNYHKASDHRAIWADLK